MDTTWSDKIKALEALGWSLRQLSEAIGITQSSVSDIKTGRTNQPRGMPAIKLHELYTAGRGPQASGKQEAA